MKKQQALAHIYSTKNTASGKVHTARSTEVQPSIYTGKHNVDNEIVAIKEIDSNFVTEQEIQK